MHETFFLGKQPHIPTCLRSLFVALRPGLFSTEMPLLLRPARRLGSEGSRAPASGPAVSAVAIAPAAVAAAAAGATSSDFSRTGAPSGVAAGLLAEESRAEVLLSLVRLGGSTGRG